MRFSSPRLFLRHAILVTCFLAMTSASARAQIADQAAAQPVPQLPSSWSDGVQSLAAKIVNLAGHEKNISLDVHNISSLTSADVAAIRQSLESELTHRRFHLVPPSQTDEQILVTLSEGVDGYLWVAQFHNDSGERVEIVSIPKTNAAYATPPVVALVLEKKLIWQQPTPFLDFAILTAPLAILEPDHLTYYFPDYMSPDFIIWHWGRNIPIPHSGPWPRDLRGSIDQDAGQIQVANVRCTGNLAEPSNMQCTPQAQASQSPPKIKVPGHNESETALLSGRCEDQSIVLSTGNGDWTQPDSIQGYLLANPEQDVRASGDPLFVDGPVTSLLPGPQQNSARAVVHNLKTANYEAYVITANCSH
jgi:hypothetical protein